MEAAPPADAVAAPAPPSSLDEALGDLFALGTAVLRTRRGSLYLRAADGASLELRQVKGVAAGTMIGRIPIEGTIAGRVVRTAAPLLVQHVAAYPALDVHPERYDTPSFLSVPVLVEHEAMGVFNAADRADGQPFSGDDLQSAEMTARAMAAVLYSDLLARRAQDEGEVDAATGLYNLRHFDKRLAQHVERARYMGVPLSLVLLGVNTYADAASRLGVQAAGLLMRSIGEMIAQTVRQSDVLARRSDDSIAILLPATSRDNARRLARALVREVRHEKLPAPLRYDIDSVGISIGVAALTPGMEVADLMRGAQDALARARRRGDAVVAVAGDGIARATRRQPPPPAHRHAIVSALHLGVPYLADPAAAAVDSAVRLLDKQMARTYMCFPVAFEGTTLTLAMADPSDTGAIQAISLATNMAIYPVASPRTAILQAIAGLMSDRASPLRR